MLCLLLETLNFTMGAEAAGWSLSVWLHVRATQMYLVVSKNCISSNLMYSFYDAAFAH